jgi:hypothetical protein
MSEVALSESELEYIFTPRAIRDRARLVYEDAKAGRGHFLVQEDELSKVVRYVMDVIAKNYPDGKIPFHSRRGHFRAGGIDRVAMFKEKLNKTIGNDSLEQARAEIDLIVTSVLLDAGAGAKWLYKEPGTGVTMGRSEGLGIASLHMFEAGAMSGDRKSMKADAMGLKNLTASDLEKHFQVTAENPMVGVGGRLGLLNALSEAVENRGIFPTPRPGAMVDTLIDRHGRTIPATGVLAVVLEGLGVIWPGRLTAKGVYGRRNLGDVWEHARLGTLIPLHKLSQWLTYSLIEPLQDAGLTVTGIEDLTGLAEYRNGGLLVDRDLIRLKDPSDLEKSWRPESELVIEWRALTIYFLDVIGREVQKALGKTPAEFPLAKVLEGGTWWAGRFAAKEKRPSSDPPIRIESDGTVF